MLLEELDAIKDYKKWFKIWLNREMDQWEVSMKDMLSIMGPWSHTQEHCNIEQQIKKPNLKIAGLLKDLGLIKYLFHGEMIDN